MKHVRNVHKGFTLIELLIVIAIIGALSATMSVVTSGATARAKAASIVANIETCKSAAMLYVLDQDSESLEEITADDVLKASVPKWIDFNRDGIKYAEVSDGKGVDGWAITVDFGSDPEKNAIKTELQKIKGYKNYNNNGTGNAIMADNVYKFKVMLTSGKIVPVS